MPTAPLKPIEAAQAALARGDWQDARDQFRAAMADRETPAGLEGLGWALWWLEDVEASFETRERAYRLYAADGNSVAAARVATALGLDIYDYQGEAITRGWLQRARRHLDGVDTAPEHGWLALWEGHFARLTRRDLETTRRLAREAHGVAEQLGIRDLELLAAALEGHALVSEGKVDDGMRLLDEATAAAISGEISDLDAAGAACCFLMHACEQARDYDRAAQWAERVADFSRRWRIRPLYAICRVHYAAVLVGRGDWVEAQEVLEGVLREVSAHFGPARSEAQLYLAELRRRQGRTDDAAKLFQEVESMSLSLIGRAGMALDAGDARSAVRLLDRALRRVAEDNWTVRASALEMLARARLETGDADGAAKTLETLQSIATLVETPHVKAMARQAAGNWSRDRGDLESARRALEDAVDLFLECRAPYEANLARLDLTRVLWLNGEGQQATSEARSAHEAFTKLGAIRAAAVALAQSAQPGGVTPGAGARVLTKRECEVLGLVAEGLGDKEIAAKLHLSEHTVHRHVANVLMKLEAPSRAAAVAQGMRRGLI